jgi:hypothetical protein
MESSVETTGLNQNSLGAVLTPAGLRAMRRSLQNAVRFVNLALARSCAARLRTSPGVPPVK